MKLPFSQILVLLAIPAGLAMLALWTLSVKTARAQGRSNDGGRVLESSTGR
jgi:hypothetical protein